MPRAVACMLAFGVAIGACAHSAKPLPPVHRDARAPAPRAAVRQGLFVPGGEANWMNLIAVEPSPAQLAEPCYAALLAEEPTFAGWMWITLEIGGEKSARVALQDSSLGISRKLWPCLIDALSRTRGRLEPGVSSFDLYLTFSPE